jgi:hypothetical protein
LELDLEFILLKRLLLLINVSNSNILFDGSNKNRLSPFSVKLLLFLSNNSLIEFNAIEDKLFATLLKVVSKLGVSENILRGVVLVLLSEWSIDALDVEAVG